MRFKYIIVPVLMCLAPVSFAKDSARVREQIAYLTEVCVQERMSYDNIISERVAIAKGEKEEVVRQGQTFRDWYRERWKIEKTNCRKIATEWVKKQF